jgi:HEAT repeat protein
MIAGTLTDHPEAASFTRQFQERHVDELGFLIAHRAVQLRLGRWADTDKHERRIAAHLAALGAHGAAALDLATQLLASRDQSTRAGAAYALAALGDDRLRARLFASLAIGVPRAVARALALVPAPALAADLERQVLAGDEALALAAATILGQRGETAIERLLDLAASVGSDTVLAALAIALSRTGSRSAWPALYAAARRNPVDFRLLTAMVVAGDPEGLRRARSSLEQTGGSLAEAATAELSRAIALAGDAADVGLLGAHIVRAPEPVLHALGLLGVPDAVATILPHLESAAAPVRRAAALALETLTGAGLPPGETDTRDKDQEGDKDDDGEVGPDTDLMLQVERSTLPVCTHAGAWRDFWRNNADRFSGARRRFRRGRPWSFVAVIDDLATLPLFLSRRQFEADELAARSGLPPLDAAGPLARQREQLALLRTRLIA